MGAVLQIGISLVTHECSECHITYAIPARLDERAREHGEKWCCPHGHWQIRTKTEVQILREQLEAKEREVEAERRRTEIVRTELRGARISEGKAKSALSRAKQRIGGGTCPCCKRNFTALRRHMATKHPDYRAEAMP